MAKKSRDRTVGLIERIDSILSENALLTAMLRGLSRSEMTDDEFELVLEALDRLENRVSQTRVKLA